MSANFGLGCVALAEKRPELAMNYFRDAAILPDNLGSGLWHEALRVPAYYMQGVALYLMHRQEESEACFQKVLDIPLDYFSQKQFPELPCYQAKILQSRGETEAANVLLQAHESAIQAMRRTKDSGYFQATPHFIVYCDTARLLRKAAADWQSSMLAWARSEKNLAIERACDALVNDPFILYAPYMAKGMM